MVIEMNKKPKKKFLELARQRIKENEDEEWWTEDLIIKRALWLQDNEQENSIRIKEYQFN
jgi:hypothetical protein